MNSISLRSLVFSATLFLGAAAPGQSPVPSAIPADPAAATLAEREAELLRRFDLNHDGKLDDAEKAAAHDAMREVSTTGKSGGAGGGVSRLQQRALQLFDANHNGKLEPDEERAAQQYFAKSGLAGAIRDEAIARFDKDGDGRLDAEERAAAAKYSQEHPGEIRRAVLLRLFDKNGDGKLDADERAAMEAALKAPASASAKATPAPTS